jgi:glucosamine--fructose-6-phosphate aminotransferase (isomerizing)
VEWSRAEVSRGEYEDFMLKEIYEQPELVERIAQAKKEEYAGLLGALKKTSDVCLLGCGSAAYVALAGTYIFPSLAKKAVSYAVGSEFRATVNAPRGSLVLALSQSGETMDIIESVKAARKNKATVGALVNVPGSTLFRFADEKTLIGAGPEKAVASTKALVGKLSWLFLLADELVSGRTGMRKELVKAARSLRLLLEPTGIARIKALAERIKDARHLYVVGRGISYPASLETALKIKEISYIHAEGMAGGELKHGVIALIEKGTPCIVFAPDDETRAGALAGAMEMKARGGYIIGIGSKPADVFDEFLPVADAGIATVIPHIAAGQLLAYYLTKALGYDADKPRNLAKSVTVK